MVVIVVNIMANVPIVNNVVLLLVLLLVVVNGKLKPIFVHAGLLKKRTRMFAASPKGPLCFLRRLLRLRRLRTVVSRLLDNLEPAAGVGLLHVVQMSSIPTDFK